jgi:fructose-specific phosphotransferase system component IIB
MFFNSLNKRMENFQRFLDDYYKNSISVVPLRRMKSQSPFFDIHIKKKFKFYKGESYPFFKFKLSLVIPGEYINERSGFDKQIRNKIEELKQKAREKKVEINLEKNGGVTFYRNIKYEDVFKKLGPKLKELDDSTGIKQYLEREIRNTKSKEEKKILEKRFIQKVGEINPLIKKLVKIESEKKRPELRIVK